MKLPGLTARTARAGRNERLMRRALAFAAGLTATLVLAQPALAATERAANMPSTVLAGYDFTYYIGVPGNVSAIIVVPKLNCTGTPSTGSAIYAGVGIQSVNSYARLALACTPQGVASYTHRWWSTAPARTSRATGPSPETRSSSRSPRATRSIRSRSST